MQIPRPASIRWMRSIAVVTDCHCIYRQFNVLLPLYFTVRGFSPNWCWIRLVDPTWLVIDVNEMLATRQRAQQAMKLTTSEAVEYEKTARSGRHFGGLYWTRTSDPIDVNDVLYQLSQQTRVGFSGFPFALRRSVTFRSGGGRSYADCLSGQPFDRSCQMILPTGPTDRKRIRLNCDAIYIITGGGGLSTPNAQEISEKGDANSPP
jgi:hypothetical protein